MVSVYHWFLSTTTLMVLYSTTSNQTAIAWGPLVLYFRKMHCVLVFHMYLSIQIVRRILHALMTNHNEHHGPIPEKSGNLRANYISATCVFHRGEAMMLLIGLGYNSTLKILIIFLQRPMPFFLARVCLFVESLGCLGRGGGREEAFVRFTLAFKLLKNKKTDARRWKNRFHEYTDFWKNEPH